MNVLSWISKKITTNRVASLDEFTATLSERGCTGISIRPTRAVVRGGPSSGNTAPIRIIYGAEFQSLGGRGKQVIFAQSYGYCRASRAAEQPEPYEQGAIQSRLARIDETLTEIQSRLPQLAFHVLRSRDAVKLYGF